MDQEDYQRNTAKDYLDAIQAAYDRLADSQVGMDAAAFINAKTRGEGDENIPLRQMKAHKELLHAKATLEHAKALYQETLGQTSLAFEHQQAEGNASVAYWKLSADITRQSASRTR